MRMDIASVLNPLFHRATDARDELPIREELYSVERLEQYAATLAAEHRVSDSPRRGRRLLPRLEENARALVAAYHTLAEAIRRESAISPAAEWFVDNFHIVEDQLREVREDRRLLPRTAQIGDGRTSGLPAHLRARLGPHCAHRQPP